MFFSSRLRTYTFLTSLTHPCCNPQMFGRRPVMIISFFLFTFFNLGISLCHNVPSLLILRFISG